MKFASSAFFKHMTCMRLLASGLVGKAKAWMAEEVGRELASVRRSKCADLLLISSPTSFYITASRFESQRELSDVARRPLATPIGTPSPQEAAAERETKPPSCAHPGGRVEECAGAEARNRLT
jgi:hypothetical protein